MSTPTHTFYDGHQNFNVHGTELAKAESTPKADTKRQVVLQVFRLDESGRYAVVSTTRSRVFHDGKSPCTTRSGDPRGERVTYDDLSTKDVACPFCRPNEDEADDDTVFYLERDRSRITICEDQNAVRLALHSKTSSGTMFLSNLGAETWEQFTRAQDIPEEKSFDIR